MRNILTTEAASWIKQAIAVVLAIATVAGPALAQTVTPGPPIVTGTTPNFPAFENTINPPPPIHGFWSGPPPQQPQWDVTTLPDGSLNIAINVAGSLQAPVASMTIPFQTGFYDTTLGQQMGCSVQVLMEKGKLAAQKITCPLIAKTRPTLPSTRGPAVCLIPPPDNTSYQPPVQVPMIDNTLCLMSAPATYSSYQFQCGLDIRAVWDASTRQTSYVPFCDAVDIKFPIELDTTSHNKSGKILKDTFMVTLQDADNTEQTTFKATYKNATAITNPDELGWVNVPKDPKPHSCDEGRDGVNFGVLLGGCTDSKGVQIAQEVMVGAALLIVGAFAGPALGGLAGVAEEAAGGLRFLVVDEAEYQDATYTAFLN